jgi:hypothetical protein
VARIFEARGAAGPPYGRIKCTSPHYQSQKPLLTLTFGGMCMLPQHRGGACFCTRDAMRDYNVVLFILAMAKTVTPAGGPRREPGRAVPPTT